MNSGTTNTRIATPRPLSVFGLGTVVVDHQVFLDTHPEADTKAEVITDRYQIGGPVPTALCLLQRLGLQTTFQGRWGNDSFGQMIGQDLQHQGINPISSPANARESIRSGFAHVWVEQATGRRTIAAYRGSHQIHPQDLALDQLAAHHALHLDGWSTAAAQTAAAFMQSKGKPVFLDLGSPKPHLDALLENVDVLNCPSRLIYRLFNTDDWESGARQLLAMGPSEVTVTLGSAGAWHVTSSSTTRHPGFTVNAVDTTGAGDVFTGALLYGSLRQWTASHKLAFACAAAALKCQHPGNRTALPTLQATLNFAQLPPALAPGTCD